ncbi:hypothetical protein DPEC_G00301860 [Dallia pectoralis]|uniref:Uncharacterized protein n=1 Tax=Dallia pectoralis TaxID=75939 RepID=A0ACC2FGS1_DALPE|nr:hypothetical protein DPEC_G00301860 [Dallia pectoralis]
MPLLPGSLIHSRLVVPGPSQKTSLLANRAELLLVKQVKRTKPPPPPPGSVGELLFILTQAASGSVALMHAPSASTIAQRAWGISMATEHSHIQGPVPRAKPHPQ